MIRISHNWSKAIKIIGIILVAIPLLCSGYKKINYAEFKTEQNSKEIERLATVALQFDDRMDLYQTNFEILLKTNEDNQKQIMKQLEEINSRIWELTKKAKW